jgi:hypothetical protein
LGWTVDIKCYEGTFWIVEIFYMVSSSTCLVYIC